MGAHLALVNAVADCVKTVYPDVKVGTLAYQYTRKPPKNITPRDNVMVQLCSIECNLLTPLNNPDDEWNKPFAEDLHNWGKITKDLWIWDYIVDYYYYNIPFPNLKAIGENIRYYRDNNVKGVFMEANYQSPAGEMEELRNYVTAKCLWNPDLDSWELTKEFCKLYYGKAGRVIFNYLNMLHDYAEKNKLKARFNATPQELGLTPEMSTKILDMFDKALLLADNDTIRDRVERAAISALCAYIETCRGEAIYNNGKLNYNSSPRYIDAVKRYIDYSKKHNMTYSIEDEPPFFPTIANEYLKEISIYEQGGRNAARIENNFWRITLLPDEDAKIVDMLYKPTNANMLSALNTDLKYSIFTETLNNEIYKDSIPQQYKVSTDNNKIILTKTLSDNSIYQREIILDNEKIICKTTIQHKGDNPKKYKIDVLPNFDTDKRTRATKIIQAYIKNKNNWLMFNEGLIGSHGPNEIYLETYKKHGSIGFVNTETKKGIKLNYKPDNVEQLKTSWTWSGGRMLLGFTTPVVTLKKDQSYSFSYSFEFCNNFK